MIDSTGDGRRAGSGFLLGSTSGRPFGPSLMHVGGGRWGSEIGAGCLTAEWGGPRPASLDLLESDRLEELDDVLDVTAIDDADETAEDGRVATSAQGIPGSPPAITSAAAMICS